MDKQASQAFKRSPVMTLCMLAATVTTLTLAGCGNGDDEMPPAEQPAAMEQDATTTAPAESDPGLGEDPEMSQESMQEPMQEPTQAPMDQEPMPSDSQAAGTVSDPEERPGFGEGTDPMPGTDDGSTDASSGDQEDDMTRGQ